MKEITTLVEPLAEDNYARQIRYDLTCFSNVSLNNCIVIFPKPKWLFSWSFLVLPKGSLNVEGKENPLNPSRPVTLHFIVLPCSMILA